MFHAFRLNLSTNLVGSMLTVLLQIDPSKSTRIFDFFVHSGWIQKV